MEQYERQILLKRMSINELKELANRYRVQLVKETFFGGPKPATRKDDIVKVLANSSINDYSILEELGPKRLKSKEEVFLLMSVKELKEMAKSYNVRLEKEGWFGTTPATRRGDIIEVLSGNLSLKQMQNFLIKKVRKPVKKKKARKEIVEIKEKIDKNTLYLLIGELFYLTKDDFLRIGKSLRLKIPRSYRHKRMFEYLYDNVKYPSLASEFLSEVKAKRKEYEKERKRARYREDKEFYSEEIKQFKLFLKSLQTGIVPKEILVKVEKPSKKRKIKEEKKSDKTTKIVNKIKQFKARKRYKKERMYEEVLGVYLDQYFDDIRHQFAVGHYGKIDMTIGKIGIEIKLLHDKNELNRLFGQLRGYSKFFDRVIVVLFDPTIPREYIQTFKKDIKDANWNVTIVEK